MPEQFAAPLLIIHRFHRRSAGFGRAHNRHKHIDVGRMYLLLQGKQPFYPGLQYRRFDMVGPGIHQAAVNQRVSAGHHSHRFRCILLQPLQQLVRLTVPVSRRKQFLRRNQYIPSRSLHGGNSVIFAYRPGIHGNIDHGSPAFHRSMILQCFLCRRFFYILCCPCRTGRFRGQRRTPRQQQASQQKTGYRLFHSVTSPHDETSGSAVTTGSLLYFSIK